MTILTAFDGVVNAFLRQFSDNVPEQDRIFRDNILSGYRITYSPETVDWINRMNDEYGVLWLTMWEGDSGFDRIGLSDDIGHLRVSDDDHFGNRVTRMWKRDAAARYVREHPGERVVWIESDLSVVQDIDSPDVLIVIPSADEGLTFHQMSEIEDFLAG